MVKNKQQMIGLRLEIIALISSSVTFLKAVHAFDFLIQVLTCLPKREKRAGMLADVSGRPVIESDHN